MKGFKKLKVYLETHFAVSFILIFVCSILTIVTIFQGYLKQEYIRYLMKQNYETENAVMDSVQRNVQYSLKELINKGAELATEEELYALSERADSLTGDEQIIAKNYLYKKMSDADYLKNITAAAVVGPNGVLGQYDKYRSALYKLLWAGENEKIAVDRSNEMHSKIKAGEKPRYLVFTEPGESQSNTKTKIFHVAYPLSGKQKSALNTEYALIISYSMDTFKEFLNTVEIPEVEYIQGYIADEDGRIIYHKDSQLIGKNEKKLLNKENVGVITKPVGYFGWTMNIIMDENEMKSHVSAIYNKGIALYMLLIALGVAVLSVIISRLFGSMKQISAALKEVEKGNYQNPIEIKGKHEIWQMAEEYNKMIAAIDSKNHEIQRQYQENLLAVQRQQQAERKTLESQINAHFICNTLGSINYEAIEAGDHKVSVLIKKLSNILRYTFDQKSQDVYIFQEIAWIDQYLFLQKNRYESFDYEIEFPDIYNYWPCCKLIFQPFVENSILHGFEGREVGGMVRIIACADGERLKISIQDNGCGMPEDVAEIIREILRNKGMKSRDSKEKTGIGIHNVVTRMYMYYGDKLDIEMETEQGRGTRFTFRIPIPEKNTDMQELAEGEQNENYNS